MSQLVGIVETLKAALNMPDVEMVANIQGLIQTLEEEIREADEYFARQEAENRAYYEGWRPALIGAEELPF